MRFALRFRPRRLLGWALFAILLACLGVLLYLMLPAEPRWANAGGPRDLFVCDGAVVVAVPLKDNARHGPVQLWDVATGRELDRFFADDAAFLACAHSRDGRYVVAVTATEQPEVQRIRWLDVKERRTWDVEARLGGIDTAVFSPACDFVAVRQPTGEDGSRGHVVAETATGRVLDRFTTAADREGESNDSWDALPPQGQFVGDGRCFAISYGDADGIDHTRLVEPGTGKVTDLADARALVVGPDGRFLLIRRPEGEWAWDVHAMDWLGPIAWPKTVPIASPDGRWIAVYARDDSAPAPVEIRDARTGATHWKLVARAGYGAMLSPDGRFLLVHDRPKAWQMDFTLYDVQERRPLWQRTWADDFGMFPLFTPDSRTIVAGFSDARVVEILDAATGTSRHTLSFPRTNQLDVSLSRDGRTLFVFNNHLLNLPSFWDDLLERIGMPPGSASEDLVHVYDLATAEERCRVPIEIMNDAFWFIEDGRSMVIRRHASDGGHVLGTTVLSWDVPPREPLRWVIGVPLAVGAVLLATQQWYGRVRARKPVSG